jgi:putative DNA primase/helicase
MISGNFSESKRRIFRAAKLYASMGWPVFVQSYTDDWEFEPTTDELQIRQMFCLVQKPLLYIATGSVSGLVAVEVSAPVGRLTAFHLEKAGLLPNTLTALTGSGAGYLIYKHPGFYVSSEKHALGAGVHIHGEGGFIQAPSSRNRFNGKVIEWLGGKPYQPTVELHPRLINRISKRFSSAA